MFSSVAAFHRAFRLPVSQTPAFPDQATRLLRQRLLDEESGELRSGAEKSDLVEIADALADICYIAAGTADVYGICPAEDPKFAQPSGAPRLADHERGMITLVEAGVDAVRRAEAENDLVQVGLAIDAVITACDLVAKAFQIPLQACFDEVHASNMTKLGADGLPLLREDGKILKGPNYRKPDLRAVLAAHGYV